MNLNRSAVALFAVVATLASAAAAGAQPAEAFDSHFTASVSGNCIRPQSINGAAFDNGLVRALDTCPPDTFEPNIFQWALRSSDVGPIAGRRGTWNRYYLQSSTASQCLDDTNGRTEDKALMQTYACNTGSTTMKWTLGRTFRDRYELINARSGKCLQVETGPTNNGYLTQFTCNSTADRPNETELFGIPGAAG